VRSEIRVLHLTIWQPAGALGGERRSLLHSSIVTPNVHDARATY
jgi:hypothetical protein